MEELQLLVKMIADLPALAIWVLVGFWCYKVVVIGSIYGVIRLGIVKAYDWKTSPKQYQLWTKTIDEATALTLAAQVNRLLSPSYIHMSDVEKLRKAIDYIEKQESK